MKERHVESRRCWIVRIKWPDGEASVASGENVFATFPLYRKNDAVAFAKELRKHLPGKKIRVVSGTLYAEWSE